MVTASNRDLERASAPRVIDVEAIRPQPWRNRGGRTRELLALPSAEAWRLRVSLADVEADGPFSPYPGVVRWIAAVAGDGMTLDFVGNVVSLRPGDAPLRFDGAAAPGCRLRGGATLDLNLMLRDADGAMLAAEPGVWWRPRSPSCGLFARVAGCCALDDGPSTAVPAHALVWFDRAPRRLCFTPDGDTMVAAAFWLCYAPRARGVTR